MSWQPEVRVHNDARWYGNSLRFATREEAEASAADLHRRWMLAVESRASESQDPVNYKLDLKTMVMNAV